MKKARRKEKKMTFKAQTLFYQLLYQENSYFQMIHSRMYLMTLNSPLSQMLDYHPLAATKHDCLIQHIYKKIRFKIIANESKFEN